MQAIGLTGYWLVTVKHVCLHSSSPIEMRSYNDRAMKLSQSFIYPEGLPNRPQYK